MALVSVNCPNCNGEVQLEENMEKGFCLYCGSLIMVRDAVVKMKVEHSGTVSVSGISSIKLMKANAKKAWTARQFHIAAGEWSKIISIDPTDYESYWGKFLLWMRENRVKSIFDARAHYGAVVYEHNVRNIVEMLRSFTPPDILEEYEIVIKNREIDDGYFSRQYDGEEITPDILRLAKEQIEKNKQYFQELDKLNEHARQRAKWSAEGRCSHCGGEKKYPKVFTSTFLKCKSCGKS